MAVPASATGAISVMPEFDTPRPAVGVPGELQAFGLVDGCAGFGFVSCRDAGVVRSASPHEGPSLL